ncbi:MAG TPA: amino acid adenylation domain-containing protein, partial [Pyrinomonadaceae bacterium]|nr:amino acid adenylation domain-containing protein [Pyrinomonadaceae bacterium]
MIGIDRSLAINLKPRTVVELLRLRVQDGPERAAYRFLSDGETEQERITYGELDARARRIAAVLKSAGASGERALLLYPPGLDYVAAFFGCLYAGVVAVPAYPPRANRNLQRLQAIASDAQAAHALTTKSILTRVELAPAQKAGLEHLRWLATDDDALDSGSQLVEPEQFDAEALAYLQYTSGSTSLPKGVMISHGNVLHNSAYIHQGFGHTPESVSLSWLPHFHDMGLLDGIIQPLYGGFTGILMSPAAFLQRPLRWLEAVGRYRVTHTGGPNFAYDLCARRVGEEARAALDLSSWRVAYNGAEPVRAETLERFAETFAPCGFRWEAFYPAYGLAEATLKVSGGQAGGAPVLCTLRGNALEENRVVAAAGDEEGARTLVGSGTTALGTEVRVVRPESLSECQPGEVGEIWVKGPGVAAGYWNRPEESERTFRAYLGATEEGPFLRTGDLGFVKDGELFVTGRLKDLIIIRGRNHYPQDIEAAVESSHAALRRGSGVAFSVEMGSEERLVVAQEVEARQQVEWQEVIGRIREAIAEEFEVQPAAVLLLKPGAVPKTSSGKLQRNASRIKFLGNDWDMVAEWRAPTGDEAPERAPFESTPAQIESLDASSLENWLRTKLAAMLGVSAGEIDVSVPLARYGVDSVASIELMHAVETGLGVRLPLAEFLQSPSLVELAARAAAQLQKAGDEKPDAHAPHPPQIEAEHAGENWHPLSHNQKSLWFLRQIAPESAAYNLSFAARIRGSLDAEALRRAFQTLTERHASLRTSFGAVMGESAQRVHASAVLSFQTEDARSLSEASLRERMSLEAHRPFDLEQAPLLRIFLFERAEQEHVLMLVAHHIVVDFWSLSILMRELGALYEEDSNGARAILDAPGQPYTNYVGWQRELLESAEGEALRNYWQRELAGELPVLDLPTDYPRPAVQSHRGASLPLRLDAGLTSRLKSLARASDATLYTVLLAAFEVLLYRHTGQREVLVGSPTSGRSLAEVSNSVGYFVNPVVLRARLSGSTGFDELLAETRRTALAAFAHQDYPFDLLVKALQPERDPARSPLFQTMFALHRAHGQAGEALAAFALGEEGAQVRLGGLSLESVALEQRIAQFDLSLTVAEVDEELAASFEYCTDLFEPSTVERMAGHFRVLLEAIAADSSKRLDELPLLTATEREQLLFEWNGGERQGHHHEQFVHQLFERHAAESPGHAAVVHEGAELTYAQLNARANQLARHLRARGVGPNVLVALCVERSFEMLVGLLGILKAGGAYVPLDPAYPRERLAFMLRDSGAPLVLTQRKFSDELAATGGAGLIRLDADWATIARESDANTRVEIHADNLAYVIYTSGSTGVPKGVMIGHGSLTNYIEAVTGEYGATPDDRFLQFASLSFDISVEEIFSCLTHGATLVLRGDEMTASTVALLRECRERKITVLNLPTAYWHQLSANLTADDWAREAVAVRLVVTGGEKIRPERLSEWHSAVGERARLVDIYGPTEATVGATICDLTGAGGAENSSRRITIGRPVRNTQAYVLDARLEPVPVGVAGELHLGGAGLALGYLNCPEATAGKFIPNPFSRTTGARLYKTGDLARFLPDGTLEFLGRLDDQVKVRGFRIELGEIERALVRHARVGDAAVLLRDDDGEKRLVAYVVADASGASDAADAADAADGVEAPDAGELRRYLKESLPDYMLPSAFVMLGELPLTPNGKVDRRALPAPGPSRPRLASAFVAPQSEVEKSLAAIWADVLKLERVGTGDNFFELGGDSILAIQVIARAQSDGVRLTASQMFKHPTVAELAAVADTATP